MKNILRLLFVSFFLLNFLQAEEMPPPDSSGSSATAQPTITTVQAPQVTSTPASAGNTETTIPKGQDYVLLSEDKKISIDQDSLTKIKEFNKQVEQALNTIQQVLDLTKKNREDSYKKYQDIDTKLGSFLQKYGELQGKIQDKITRVMESSSPTEIENLSNYKKEIDKIKESLDSLNKIENKSLDILHGLDDKASNLLDESLAVKKLIINVFKSTNAGAINSNKSILDNALKKSEEIKKYIQESFLKEFNDNINKLETDMKKMETDFNVLETKGNSLGLDKIEIKQEPKQEVKQEVKQEKVIAPKPELTKDLAKEQISYYQKGINFVALCTSYIKSGFTKTQDLTLTKTQDLSLTSTINSVTPEWRKGANLIFNKLLDLTVFLVEKTVGFIKSIYRFFLKGPVDRFFLAVKNRLDQIEAHDKKITLTLDK